MYNRVETLNSLSLPECFPPLDPFSLEKLMDDVAEGTATILRHKEIELISLVDAAPATLYGQEMLLEALLCRMVRQLAHNVSSGEIIISVEPSSEVQDSYCFSLRYRHGYHKALLPSSAYAPHSFDIDEDNEQQGYDDLLHTLNAQLVKPYAYQDKKISFSLPLKAGSDARSTIDSSIMNRLQGMRTLLVDGSDLSGNVLLGQAMACGLDASLSMSGTAALQALRQADEAGQPIELVIVDRKMPDMDGLTLALHIDEQFHHAYLPIVIMVSPFGWEVPQAYFDASIHGFLAKPVGRQAFMESVISACDACESFQPSVDEPCQLTARQRERLAGKKILLVDDSEINRRVAESLLSQAGCSVHCAENGQLGVEAVEQSHYDLVLMDIDMPIMNGYDATQHIRDCIAHRSLPIIAMTTNAAAKDIATCIEVGMNDHITKPLDAANMLSIVSQWVRDELSCVPATLQQQTAIEGASKLDMDIKGINVSDGLGRVLGNEKLYRDLLKIFVDTHKCGADDLERYTSTCDLEKAGFLVHKTKGVASTIGAYNLGDACTALQLAIEHCDYHAIEDAAPRFCCELRDVVDHINAYLEYS